MGLQDTPMMSAVPAQDVIKAGTTSAMSGLSSRQQTSLEDSLLSLTLRGESVEDRQDNDSNISVDLDDQLVTDEDDELLEDLDDDWDWEPDESRLSRALRSWMSDYVITPLPPQTNVVRQPVFSARLGAETTIRRVPSCDSITTQLSLFSCSSHGSQKRPRRRRRLRRKKTTSADVRRRQQAEEGSRWVELMKKRKGELDRFMKTQSHALHQGLNLIEESEAFQYFESDEQKALFRTGQQDKLEFASELKKCDSMTNIPEDTRDRRRQRVVSAGARKFYGNPIDFEELQQQVFHQKLAALNTPTPRRASSRRSLHRTHSRHSLVSTTSSNNNDPAVSRSAQRTPVQGGSETPTPSLRVQEVQPPKEKQVNMWKGDSEILAIDLKRELTSKVKQRIAVTATALDRVTGLGDDNQPRPYTCHLPEFPTYVDEDFAHQPKIPQKIRIAPHLSNVIKSDIKIRMGRPRYHEIRIRDVEVWTRGQTLDRAHRNLKVFNWLHSLKEDEFNDATVQQTITDELPEQEDVSFGEMVLIRAADEPDIKPLYEQKKTFIR